VQAFQVFHGGAHRRLFDRGIGVFGGCTAQRSLGIIEPCLCHSQTIPQIELMNPRAEIYRQKAVEWERTGSAAVAPTIRETLMDLAKQWRQMAGHAEHLERVYRPHRRCEDGSYTSSLSLWLDQADGLNAASRRRSGLIAAAAFNGRDAFSS
jgi:hypothetical protein